MKEAEKGSSLQELIDVIDRIDHIRRHGKEKPVLMSLDGTAHDTKMILKNK